MIYWIIGILAYVVGACVSFMLLGKGLTWFEKVWFSVFWVCLLPLWLIWYVYTHWIVGGNDGNR